MLIKTFMTKIFIYTIVPFITLFIACDIFCEYLDNLCLVKKYCILDKMQNISAIISMWCVI